MQDHYTGNDLYVVFCVDGADRFVNDGGHDLNTPTTMQEAVNFAYLSIVECDPQDILVLLIQEDGLPKDMTDAVLRAVAAKWAEDYHESECAAPSALRDHIDDAMERLGTWIAEDYRHESQEAWGR